MKKIIVSMLVVILTFGLLTACGDEPATGKITLNKSEVTLALGEATNITATPDPVTNDDLTWTSSNETVATVNGYGVVTAKGLGETTISVAAKGYVTATLKVTVEVKLTPNTSEINIFAPGEDPEVDPAETFSLSVESNPELKTSDTLTYTSSKPDVATVDEDGLVTAVAAGTASIAITCSNGGKVSVPVTVQNINTDPAVITFKVTIPAAVPSYVNVYIVGGFPETSKVNDKAASSWKPATENMMMIKDSSNPLLYTAVVTGLERKLALEYKYTLGTKLTEGNWSFSEAVDGDNGKNRKMVVNGGTYDKVDTVTLWQSSDLVDPDAFIPGEATYTLNVTLSAPLADGQWLGIIGAFVGEGFNWVPNVPDELKFTKVDDTHYTFVLSKALVIEGFECVGGKSVSFKIAIGDSEHNEWNKHISVMKENYNLNLNGGEWVIEFSSSTTDAGAFCDTSSKPAEKA